MSGTLELDQAVKDLWQSREKWIGVPTKGDGCLCRLIRFIREKLYRPVSPKRMVKKVLSAARKNPYADFGSDVKRHLSFCTVHINSYDWDAYYKMHQEEIEVLLEQELVRKGAYDTHVSVGTDVRAAICEDRTLRRGRMTVDLGEGHSSAATGARWQVHDADLIGVPRGKAGTPAPAIALDRDDYFYVSQNQGRFVKKPEGWYFVHMGRSASTIVHPDGMKVELAGSAGAMCPIEHEARIIFAGQAPVLTFLEH